MTWPPSPPVFIAACLLAWLLASACFWGLLLLSGHLTERARLRRVAAARALSPSAERVADWLDAAALADWPGPELDDAIVTRQIAVARTLGSQR